MPLDRQPKPIEKMGVVANLNERTVSFMSWVAPINTVDAASIQFHGEQAGPGAQIAAKAGYTQRIDGILDRVTVIAGVLSLSTVWTDNRVRLYIRIGVGAGLSNPPRFRRSAIIKKHGVGAGLSNPQRSPRTRGRVGSTKTI